MPLPKLKGIKKLQSKSEKPIEDLDEVSRFRMIQDKAERVQDLGCLIVIVGRDREDRDITLDDLGCQTDGFPTEIITSVEFRKAIRSEVRKHRDKGTLDEWLDHEIKH